MRYIDLELFVDHKRSSSRGRGVERTGLLWEADEFCPAGTQHRWLSADLSLSAAPSIAPGFSLQNLSLQDGLGCSLLLSWDWPNLRNRRLSREITGPYIQNGNFLLP